jgi:hypothetical protein
MGDLTRVQIAAIFYRRMIDAEREGKAELAAGIADALLFWAERTSKSDRGFFDEHRLGITLEISCFPFAPPKETTR